MDERAEPPAETPPKKRRWWRFSLRTMLLSSTVVCVWFGMLASNARRQQQAVEAIQKVHGRVTYDWEIVEPAMRKPGGPAPPGPQWLRWLLSPHYFDDVVEVRITLRRPYRRDSLSSLSELESHLVRLARLRCLHLTYSTDDGPVQEDAEQIGRLQQLEKLTIDNPYGMEVSDEFAAEIANSKGLREIDLRNVFIKPAGLREFAHLPHLESFELICRYIYHNPGPQKCEDFKLRDEGATAIAQFRQLRTLRLHQTMVTDDGVAALTTLPYLETFEVSSKFVTNASLEPLTRMKQLHTLGIGCWQVHDDDLAVLAHFPTLRSLTLDATPISDLGLVHVEKLIHLKYLSLCCERITDAGLPRLHSLKNLIWLRLSQTRATRTGLAIQQLKQAIPNCSVMLPEVKREYPEVIRLRQTP